MLVKLFNRLVGDQLGIAAISLFFLVSAALIGALTTIIPLVGIFGVLGIVILISLAFLSPLILFSAILVLWSGLVPPGVLPRIPLGPIQLAPAELLTIFLVVGLISRNPALFGEAVKCIKPFRLAFCFLVIGILQAFIFGQFYAQNERTGADLRHFVAWLLLPATVCMALYSYRRLNNVLLVVAIVSATAMLFQLVTGIQIIFGERGAEYLDTKFTDITRSSVGQVLFIVSYAAVWFFVRSCRTRENSVLMLLCSMLCVAAIVASFNRAMWAGFLFGALIVLSMLVRARIGFLWSLAVAVLTLALAFGAVEIGNPRITDAVLARVNSLEYEGSRGTSLGFRYQENQMALKTLAESPILGVGLGGRYKRLSRLNDEGGGGKFVDEEFFIHNGYLSLWLRLGVLGLLFCLFFSAAIWTCVRRSFNRSGDSSRRYEEILGVVGVMVMLSISMITSPDLTYQRGIGVIATLVGILLVTCMPTNVPALRGSRATS